MFTGLRTRLEDKLFVALLLLPAAFAGARYLESKSQMDQIALRSRPVATMVASVAASHQWAGANTSIVHRF